MQIEEENIGAAAVLEKAVRRIRKTLLLHMGATSTDCLSGPQKRGPSTAQSPETPPVHPQEETTQEVSEAHPANTAPKTSCSHTERITKRKTRGTRECSVNLKQKTS